MDFVIAVVQAILFGVGAGAAVLFGDAVATRALKALGFDVLTGDLVAFITAGLLILFALSYVVA
jgi:hypothetical protein